jgi:hypothetical protein
LFLFQFGGADYSFADPALLESIQPNLAIAQAMSQIGNVLHNGLHQREHCVGLVRREVLFIGGHRRLVLP